MKKSGEFNAMPLNKPTLSLLALPLCTLLIGCKAPVAPITISPVKQTVSAAPSQNAEAISARWQYPKILGASSGSGAANYHLRSFTAEDPLPKVWAFYAKRLRLPGKFAMGVSGANGSSQGTVSHQTAYQSREKDKLQTAFFASETPTLRIAISLSQIKGEKSTLVSLSVYPR